MRRPEGEGLDGVRGRRDGPRPRLARERPEDAVHERGRPRGPPLLGELHRLVDRGPRRDPVEERELVRREPEERPHPRGELVERTPRRASEHPVEPALPAKRAERQLRGEAAIARLEIGPVAERLEQPVRPRARGLGPDENLERHAARRRPPARAASHGAPRRGRRDGGAAPVRLPRPSRQAALPARAAPPEVGLPRHRTPVLGLDLDRLEKIRSRPDGEPAFGGREDARLPAPGDGPRAPDQEPSSRHERGRARPRIQSADAVDEARGRLRPVEQPVLLAEPRRERRGAGVLRARREGVQTVQRLEEHLGAERGQAPGELAGRLFGADRGRPLEEHRARVHPGIHLEGGDPRLALAAHDGPRDRRRAPVAREQRGVDVDRAARGDVEDRLREDLPEGHDHRDVGPMLGEPLGPAGVTEPDRLEQRDAVLERHRLDRRDPLALPPARGPVRLRHRGHHVVPLAQRLERGQRERRSAVEQHAHGVRLRLLDNSPARPRRAPDLTA